MLERQQSETQTEKSKSTNVTGVTAPPSPLKFIATYESNNLNSPIPGQRIESPVTQEDEEVVSIVKQGEFCKNSNLRQCDSVFQDVAETGKIISILFLKILFKIVIALKGLR